MERDDAMCNIKNMCAQNDVKSVNGSVENCNLEEKLGEKGVDIQEARHNSTRILTASKNVEDGELDMWLTRTPRQADHVVGRKENVSSHQNGRCNNTPDPP